MKDWEKKVLAEPGAAERVAEIEDELDHAVGWDLRLIDLGLRPPTPEPPGHDLGLGLGL